MINTALYTDRTNWKKCIIYKLQGAKLLRMFELLSDTVATTPGTMKQELLTKTLVQPDEQRQVVVGRPRLEMLYSPLIKRKDAVSLESPFRFHDSLGANIIVPRTRCSISMTVSMQNNRQHLMRNLTMLQLLSTSTEQEYGLERPTQHPQWMY